MITSPCKNCPKQGCGSYHDECPEYMLYKGEKELEYKRRMAHADLMQALSDAYRESKKVQRSRRNNSFYKRNKGGK